MMPYKYKKPLISVLFTNVDIIERKS